MIEEMISEFQEDNACWVEFDILGYQTYNVTLQAQMGQHSALCQKYSHYCLPSI